MRLREDSCSGAVRWIQQLLLLQPAVYLLWVRHGLAGNAQAVQRTAM